MDMKKTNRRSSVILVFLTIFGLGLLEARGEVAQPQASGRGFSLKLSGGMGFFLDGGGDLENLRLARIAYYQELKNDPDYTKTWVNWKKLSRTPNFNAELIYHINKNFGIGVGAGYLSVNVKSDYGHNYKTEGSVWFGTYSMEDNVSYRRSYKITAVPVTLNLYVNFPSGAFNVYAYAGGAYYFTKLTHTFAYDATNTISTHSSIFYDTMDELTENDNVVENAKPDKKNAWGLNGGLGLEVKLMSHVSLGLELFGRLADFGSWSGDYKETYTTRKREGDEAEGWVFDETSQENYSESGKLWYYDQYADALDKYFGQMFIWQNKPDEPYNKNARPARINLNTMGVALSLRVNFGL